MKVNEKITRMRMQNIQTSRSVSKLFSEWSRAQQNAMQIMSYVLQISRRLFRNDLLNVKVNKGWYYGAIAIKNICEPLAAMYMFCKIKNEKSYRPCNVRKIKNEKSYSSSDIFYEIKKWKKIIALSNLYRN